MSAEPHADKLRAAAEAIRRDWPLCTCGEEHDDTAHLEDYDNVSKYQNAVADVLDAVADAGYSGSDPVTDTAAFSVARAYLKEN